MIQASKDDGLDQIVVVAMGRGALSTEWMVY